ncbi:MAG: hypothetical protein COB02_08035 [Candidatus Cloacimonadota bacterium]|nr:MAG: hypothetical protein COB02_08035 [Candidatus Cloacimonadota bacterium]
MSSIVKKISRVAVMGAMCASITTTVQAELSDSLYGLATFGQTMGTFTNSLNQLLHSRSPQEQREMQARISYVEQQAAQQSYAIESFIAADEALASSQSSWGNFFGASNNDAQIVQVYQAFKQYQSMFSARLLRSSGQFPMPAYERMFIRWQQTPANSQMKEYSKQQFLRVFRSHARSFVHQTQSQLKRKQRRFLSELRSVEKSGPFAMNNKMSFDKAFWDYQSMFKTRSEPGSGQIYLPEFPYNNMMTTQQQPNFLYNQSIYQQSGLNRYGYGTTQGMGYQQGFTQVGMGQAGQFGGQVQQPGQFGGQVQQPGQFGGQVQQPGQFGGQIQQPGRYSGFNQTSTYQSNQVVPLGGQSQMSSPYGAFAPSSSMSLDSKLRQQLYLKQRNYEKATRSGGQNEVNAAYDDYKALRDQWFVQ